MADHIRYDLLTQQALRGVVRSVLADAAKKGLPGDHHFYISFDTRADGVRMSERLRAQYPEEMTIILQHQFWDLTVNERGVRGRPVVRRRSGKAHRAVRGDQRLLRSIGAIRPAVRGSRPRARTDARRRPMPAGTRQARKKKRAATRRPSRRRAERRCRQRRRRAAAGCREPQPKSRQAGQAGGGGEVVRLDRFRKK